MVTGAFAYLLAALPSGTESTRTGEEDSEGAGGRLPSMHAPPFTRLRATRRSSRTPMRIRCSSYPQLSWAKLGAAAAAGHVCRRGWLVCGSTPPTMGIAKRPLERLCRASRHRAGRSTDTRRVQFTRAYVGGLGYTVIDREIPECPVQILVL